MMTEAILNAYAQRFHDMTLCKSREDPWDLEWYTEGPFWRRTDMRYSREYKIIPDYEIADAKHGLAILRWNRNGLNPICGATAHRHVLMSSRAPII